MGQLNDVRPRRRTTGARCQITKENLLYLPIADSSDRWFWTSLVAPGVFSYEFTLDSVVSGPARLRAAIWASSESGEYPDHHLRIAINGTGVHEERWDGKGFRTVEAVFSTTALRDGVNRITLESPGDTGAAVDILYLDWLELSFSRAPVARQSRLEITCATSPIQPMGFDSPLQVYDITQPQRAQRVGENIEPLHLVDCPRGRRYLILGENEVLSPRKLLESQQLPDLRAVNAGADYLAIGPADLLKPLQPLLELRAAQGLKTLSVPIEAVYDQFNYGMPEPQALRALLAYASMHWKPAPRYLLLVGDASYDPKGYLAAPEANRLTVELIDTQYGGETVSDIGAVQSEQQVEQMPAIGLLPARHAEQVRGYVQKVLKYEAATPQRKQKISLLAVADGQDISFRLDAKSFLDEFPSNQYEYELFTPDAGAGDAAAQLRQRLAEGHHLVAYFGHGSLQMWGKDRLLSVEDLARLPATASLPIVLQFTCLSGYYIHPNVESLAERMLWQPNGGIVAVLAPSSLTLPYDQSFLSLSLARLLVAEPELTIGEIHLKARQQVPLDSQGAADVMRTFMLFGDPALRVSSNSP